MKKILILLGLCAALLCAASVQGGTPMSPKAYKMGAADGTFTDISATGTALGSTLQADTILRYVYFAEGEGGSAKTIFYSNTIQNSKEKAFPLGWDFNLANETMTHFAIGANGTLTLSPTDSVVGTEAYLWNNINVKNRIVALPYHVYKNASVKKGSTAPVFYQIDGTIGNHTLTVQYNFNVGPSNSPAVDAWRFQIKLHESTGKIEYIIDNLANAKDTNYSLSCGVHSALYFQNPPYKGFSSLLVVGAKKGPAGCWDSLSKGTSLTGGMPLKGCNPVSGKTLSLELPDNCTKPTTTGDMLVFNSTKIMSTSFEGTVTFAPKVKGDRDIPYHILAIVSDSAAPDFTLTPGTPYPVGTELTNGSGQPAGKVIANEAPYAYASSWGDVELKATGLKGNATHYLHFYLVDWSCTGAPFYSDTVANPSFLTAIDAPLTFKISKLGTTSVEVAVEPSGTYGTLLLSTPKMFNEYTIPTLSGKYKIGDLVDDNADIKVVGILDHTQTSATIDQLSAGTALCLHAFSLSDTASENPRYSADAISVATHTIYNTFPIAVDFSNVPPQEQGTAPIGWTSENIVPEGASFTLSSLGNEPFPSFLLSHYPTEYSEEAEGEVAVLGIWPEISSPAFLGLGTDDIIATFYTSFSKKDFHSANPYVLGLGDSVRLEYSLNYGNWTLAQTYTSENLPEPDAKGARALSIRIPSLVENDTLRVRFSYTMATELTVAKIHAWEVLAARACETPSKLKIVEGSITDQSAKIEWTDNNVTPPASYVVSYRLSIPEDPGQGGGPLLLDKKTTSNEGTEPSSEWVHFTTLADSAALTDLDSQSTYEIKVTSVCAIGDSSYDSPSLLCTTLCGLPFEESFAMEDYGTSTCFTRGFTLWEGDLGSNLTTIDPNMVQDWTNSNSRYSFIYDEEYPDGVASTGYGHNQWIVSPSIFINDPYHFEKTLEISLTSFYKSMDESYQTSISEGFAPPTDAKLHILISSNGKFTQENIVKTLDSVALGSLKDSIFRLDVSQLSGPVQVALYLHNPNFEAFQESEEDSSYNWFIECNNITLDFEKEPCFPVENITKSDLGKTQVTLTYQGSSLSYAIVYAPDGSEEMDTIYTDNESYQITHLTDGTLYNVQVIGYCGENHTDASPIKTTTFRTLMGCHVPAQFAVEGISSTGATFSSTAGSNVQERLVHIYTGSEPTALMILKQSGNTLVVKDSLLSKTSYIAKTQSVCGLGDSSSLSEPVNFTTLQIYTLTLSASPAEGGVVKGAGSFDAGATASISSTPNTGYTFVAWIKGNDTLSKERNYSLSINENISLTALFAKATANENLVKTQDLFKISTANKTISVRNLSATQIRNVEVYNLSGARLAQQDYNTHTHVEIRIAQVDNAIVFVRVTSAQGVAIYKVFVK